MVYSCSRYIPKCVTTQLSAVTPFSLCECPYPCFPYMQQKSIQRLHSLLLRVVVGNERDLTDSCLDLRLLLDTDWPCFPRTTRDSLLEMDPPSWPLLFSGFQPWVECGRESKPTSKPRGSKTPFETRCGPDRLSQGSMFLHAGHRHRGTRRHPTRRL